MKGFLCSICGLLPPTLLIGETPNMLRKRLFCNGLLKLTILGVGSGLDLLSSKFIDWIGTGWYCRLCSHSANGHS